MEDFHPQMKIKPYPGRESTPASAVDGSMGPLVVSGLWLRAGFVGASALVGGMTMLFGGEGNPAFAIALVGGGGILAPYALLRSRAALDRADASASGPSATAPEGENLRGFGSPVLR